MSEAKLYPVSKEWAERAYIDAEKYREMYRQSIDDPNGFWAEQAKRVDWMKPFTKVKNTTFEYPNVSIKWFEDGVAQHLGELHRPASEGPRRPGRDPLGGRRSGRRQEDHLSRAARACLPPRQRPEGARRQEGRPRHDLHADDPGGGLRDARLRPDRRRPLRRLRRLLAGLAGEPHRGLPLRLRHHRRRGRCAAASRSR